jgi:hypothetical protein
VNCRVRKVVIALEIIVLVVISCKKLINPVSNPNPIYSQTCDNIAFLKINISVEFTLFYLEVFLVFNYKKKWKKNTALVAIC